MWWCMEEKEDEEEEEGGRGAGDSQSGSVSPRWAWVLQDALGIAFCLYMLKTVRLPTFKVQDPPTLFILFIMKDFSAALCVFVSPQACTLLLTVLFVYDVFFVFITPFLTRVRQTSFLFVVLLCLSNVSATDSFPVCVCVCVGVCESTERREYNGGGSGWSLWLRTSWEG